jgi:hypothetical protein
MPTDGVSVTYNGGSTSISGCDLPVARIQEGSYVQLEMQISKEAKIAVCLKEETELWCKRIESFEVAEHYIVDAYTSHLYLRV